MACSTQRMMSFSRGKKSNKLALLVGLAHRVGEIGRIAVLELPDGIDADGLQQAGITLPHSLDPHAVGRVRPSEDARLVEAGLGGQEAASLGVLAASSSRSVVRIPSDFSFLSSSASRPELIDRVRHRNFLAPGSGPALSGSLNRARQWIAPAILSIASREISRIDICYECRSGLSVRTLSRAGRCRATISRNANRRRRARPPDLPFAREWLARDPSMNADGHSRRRPLGASAGDEISDQLTHLPLVSPTLR